MGTTRITYTSTEGDVRTTEHTSGQDAWATLEAWGSMATELAAAITEAADTGYALQDASFSGTHDGVVHTVTVEDLGADPDTMWDTYTSGTAVQFRTLATVHGGWSEWTPATVVGYLVSMHAYRIRTADGAETMVPANGLGIRRAETRNALQASAETARAMGRAPRRTLVEGDETDPFDMHTSETGETGVAGAMCVFVVMVGLLVWLGPAWAGALFGF